MTKLKAIFKILAYILLAFILFINLSAPFRGSSTFFVTTIYYLTAICSLLYVAYLLKQKVYAFTLVAVSLFVGLYIAEVFLRYVWKYPVTYSEKQWGEYKTMYDSPDNKVFFLERILNSPINYHTNVMQPNMKCGSKTIEFVFDEEYTNSLGMRGKLPKVDKKVVCTLGDSFTESFGAPADSTYPKLLGNLLSSYDSNIAVLNAGISGSDPFFEFMLLKDLKKTYNFTDALFMVNGSDITDVISRGGTERFVANGDLQFRKAPWWEPMYAISYVFRLVMHNLAGIGFNLMTTEQQKQEESKAILLIKNHFADDILPWAKQNNVRIYVVLQPMKASAMKRDNNYEQIHRQLSAIKEINFLDLQPALHRTPNIESYFWKIDGHFKSRGYKLTAELVFDSFLKRDHN